MTDKRFEEILRSHLKSAGLNQNAANEDKDWEEFKIEGKQLYDSLMNAMKDAVEESRKMN